MKFVFDLLWSALNDLVAFNKRFRDEIACDARDCMGDSDYAMSFGAIRCDPGRLTGKTKYIKDKLENENAILICSKKQKQMAPKELQSRVFSLNDALNGLDVSFDIAFIDDARFLLPTEEDEMALFNAIATDKQKTFVLLG